MGLLNCESDLSARIYTLLLALLFPGGTTSPPGKSFLCLLIPRKILSIKKIVTFLSFVRPNKY
jgi:hypothetical protein